MALVEPRLYVNASGVDLHHFASAFFFPEYWLAFMVVFLVAMFNDSHRHSQLRRAMGEFLGAIEVLKLLGMIPDLDGDSDRKKVTLWERGAELVKGRRRKEKAEGGVCTSLN